MAFRRVTGVAMLCAVAGALVAGGSDGVAATRWPSHAALAAATTVPAAEVSVGAFHACARTIGGGAKCWGANGAGQLGNLTNTVSTTPVDVYGLGSGVAAISAGGSDSCALTTGGGVKCWGANGAGQLGNGTTTAIWSPVDVSGLGSGVAAISVGTGDACALTTGGGVKCWGDNRYGQLGNGTTTNSTTPVDVSGLSTGVAAISVGFLHACALTTGGGVKCWGDNAEGELGNGNTKNRTTPVAVYGLGSGVAAISAGVFTTCALTTAGGAKCWGGNGYGQLGNGTRYTSPTPVDVSGLTSGVAALSAGGNHTCAITTGGGAKCWGRGLEGELGDGKATNSTIPVDVSGLSTGVAAVSAGVYTTCALATSGGVKCWGQNNDGQLGNGTTTNRLTPVDVIGFGPASKPVLCVVPNVKGKSLSAAKRAITANNCSVGRIKHATSRRVKKNHVISQKPTPRTHLNRGAKVSLVVSKGR